MTALSAARLIVEKEDVFSTLPVKGATTLHQGALVCMDGGVAVPGKTALALTAIGVSVTTVVYRAPCPLPSVQYQRWCRTSRHPPRHIAPAVRP